MGNDSTASSIQNNWTQLTLGELLDENGGTVQTGPFGSQLHAADYVENGIPSVMPKNISIEGISQADIARITDKDALRLSKYLLVEDDIIYSRRGDVEKCALVKPEESGWLCGTGCLRIRLGDTTKVSSTFLHAYLSTPVIREWISRNAIGATMPNLNTSILRDVPLVIPSPNEVKFIGNIWKELNQKITLNRQTNQTLEHMAQALFKSWFVDFDPVFDNAFDAGLSVDDFPDELQQRAMIRQQHRFEALQQGAEVMMPQTPQSTAVLQPQNQQATQTESERIRGLFPSEFEQCDDPSIGISGWIPKGWVNCQMKDVVDIASSKRVFANDYVDNGVPFFRGKEITELSQGKKINTEIFISEEKYQDLKEKSGAPKQGDILITSVGTIGNTYLVKENDKFYFKDGNLTWIRGYRKDFVPFYIKEWFSNNLGKDAIERIKIGTTQQAITIKALNGINILIPSSLPVLAFENITKNIFEKHDHNIDSIDSLAKLRDTLLPKLISGELQLSEAVQSIETK